VASTIAEKLHQLSQSQQLLCVTHQPIIAAMADQHFRVDKQIIDAGFPKKNKKNIKSTESINDDPIRTVVRVTPLSHSQRQTELAQLASGQPAEEAIAFAASLLAQANSHRQNN
ncbi:MAG: DNA repair protein RecN, partial [Microcoleaceae cyanobacterium]